MVNRGQPSKDCFPCRKRKLRCDLRVEGCGQCERAKIRCHGFRDPIELAFRDESHTVEQKVIARQTARTWVEPTTLQPGWDVRSRQAFFSIYVSRLSRSCDALVPLYSRASLSGTLSASIDAVSLALMSTQLNSRELLKLARLQYVIAIKGLRRTLQVPGMCASDETLQSVLLLDLYEKMVNRDPRRSASWMSHIQGAMSLVTTRGSGGLSGSIACKLSSRVAIKLMISCGVNNVPIPTELMSLRKSLDSSIGDLKWDFAALVVDVVNLRDSIRNGGRNCTTGLAERVQELDNRLNNLDMTLLQSCVIRRVFLTDDHPHVFDNHYDIYPDHFITQTWNAIRMMRLELNSIMRDFQAGRKAHLEVNASKTISQITQQICASAPQFFLPDARVENELHFSPLQKLQCSTLLTPLFLASQLSADHRMQNWVQHIMLHIAEAGNLMVAKEVSKVLRANPDTDYWTVYAMTGCYALAA